MLLMMHEFHLYQLWRLDRCKPSFMAGFTESVFEDAYQLCSHRPGCMQWKLLRRLPPCKSCPYSNAFSTLSWRLSLAGMTQSACLMKQNHVLVVDLLHGQESSRKSHNMSECEMPKATRLLHGMGRQGRDRLRDCVDMLETLGRQRPFSSRHDNTTNTFARGAEQDRVVCDKSPLCRHLMPQAGVCSFRDMQNTAACPGRRLQACTAHP